MSIEHNKDFIHHTDQMSGATIRELVFGMEDGMVSTLGAITGIAMAVQNHFSVILSGFVLVSVESISMAVGSYLSSKSEKAIDERKMAEEQMELDKFPKEEKIELEQMYIVDGWTKETAEKMAREASQNNKLFLQEMAYRELKVFPDNLENPLHNGAVMGVSYVVGGAIPLLPYILISDIFVAVVVSVVVTLVGLFTLGVFAAQFSKRAWWKVGLEMLGLASAAAFVGYAVGQAVDVWWVKK